MNAKDLLDGLIEELEDAYKDENDWDDLIHAIKRCDAIARLLRIELNK